MPKSVSFFVILLAATSVVGGGIRYRSMVEPAQSLNDWGTAPRWLGPPPEILHSAALGAMSRAVDRLGDHNRPGHERLTLYRAELAEAQRFLTAEVDADPGRSEAWAGLAAVRWELEPGFDEVSRDAFAEQVLEAVQRSENRPRAQLRLGELLLRLGLDRDGAACFDRAIRARPDLARTAVESLSQRRERADGIAARLPFVPTVLLALRAEYLKEGRESDYLQLLETGVDRFDGMDRLAILPAFGTTCLALGEFDRLIQKMEALGELPATEDESIRLEQLALGFSGLGRHSDAMAAARNACIDHRRLAACLESLGHVAAAAGEPEEALDALERAARNIAARSGDSNWISRLQLQQGRIEEERLEFGRARSAYRRALRSNPANRAAKLRLAGLDGAVPQD